MAKKTGHDMLAVSSQLVPVLMTLARLKRTATYGDAIKLTGWEGAPPVLVARALSPIYQFCKAVGAPSPHILLVNKETGVPGKGAWDEDKQPMTKGEFEAELQKVYDFNWGLVSWPDFEKLRQRPDDEAEKSL